MKYIVVINARNEEKNLPTSLPAIKNQSLKPIYILGVNDDSTDSTEQTFRDHGVDVISTDFPRIKKRGFNQSRAFNAGVAHATELYPDWEAVLKMDADCVITQDYAELLVKEMEDNPKLGMVGGTPEGEKIRVSRVTDGARLIRRECWDQIGGYTVMTAFDSHAILKAKQAGWETRTYKYPTYGETRSSNKFSLQRWWSAGVLRKSWGHTFTHTLFAAAKNSLTGRPIILNAIVMVTAYIVSNPEPDPYLDQKWVAEYSTQEIKDFLKNMFK